MSEKSESVKRTQKKKKMLAVEAFGGKCCICEYNKCVDALEFHHLDKSEKEESPAYIIMRWSFEKAKKELDKCILVCSNCHREIHHNEREQKDLSLQRYRREWIEKDCVYCGTSYSTKNHDQKYCSVTCQKMDSRKVERPNKEELKELIEKYNWCEIGRKFSVSDNAVRKWARNYELI